MTADAPLPLPAPCPPSEQLGDVRYTRGGPPSQSVQFSVAIDTGSKRKQPANCYSLALRQARFSSTLHEVWILKDLAHLEWPDPLAN